MVAPSPAPALHERHAKEVAQYCASLPHLRPKPPTDQAAVDQRKNIGSNCSFTHAAMIEYDDPQRQTGRHRRALCRSAVVAHLVAVEAYRAAYRGHFAGIEGSNLARSPAPEERQTAPIPGGALTRM